MDHSWRPPPPSIPGTTTNTNICPICSISHFPFCPPPPPFFENPRFHYPPPPNDYYHQPPPFNHPHPLPNHHITNNNNNYYSNPSHIRPPTWHATNPSLNITPYDVIIDHNYNNSYGGYDSGGIKRMKVEPVDNNNNNNNRGPRGPVMSRVPSDNERILKLIHDHGNAANATPTVGAGLFSESNGDVGLKRRRDVDNYNSQPPYYWSENKGHYGPNSFGLPPSPPPPLPVDMPRNHFYEPHASVNPPPPKQPSLFPVAVSSSADASSGSAVLENQSAAPVYYGNNARRATSLSPAEDFHIRQFSSEKHARDVQPYPLRRFSSDKQDIIDASHIFKKPHRASRPDHFVIILRGLPGSGKSYLAKMLRDIEVENGGEAPRIHSMDEYFMIEVEKAEDSELSKSSGSLRGKRQVMKTVMEYSYEPEMEEAYRASMLKAFKKTLDEGVYSFIIVDDRNLRVADFAQFWATAKRSGYEVYLVEASYKDPAGCAARNVHNCTLADIQKMAGQWEEAPPLYLKMDIKSLLHGDGLVESDIQEVDMDMEDEDANDASQESDVKRPHDETKDQVDDSRLHDELKDVTVTTHQTEEVKDLSRSKWSNNFDAEEEEDGKKKISGGALSGLVQTYGGKEAKSVSWGDQGGDVGFSISATRKANTRSLVIGPGPGYNLKSNPLSEEDYVKPPRNAVEPRAQSVFQERIRAERESFKAVFDKRRQRIGGFNMDEE